MHAYLALALVSAMQAVEEIDALDAQAAKGADEELALERELADVEAEGDQERRRGHQSSQVQSITRVAQQARHAQHLRGVSIRVVLPPSRSLVADPEIRHVALRNQRLPLRLSLRHRSLTQSTKPPTRFKPKPYLDRNLQHYWQEIVDYF